MSSPPVRGDRHPRHPPVPWRSRPRRILLGLLVAVGTLACLNALAFLGEVLAYGTRYSAGQPAGLYVNVEGERPRLKPGARLPGLLYSISVNSSGFRGPDLAEPKPPGGLRVWCVGGSTTFDIYAPDDAHTWPAVAGRHLSEALPRRVVEVINAGVPGEILWGSTDDLRRMGPGIEPDYVVIYHGPNDLRTLTDQKLGPVSRGIGLPPVALVRVVSRWTQAHGTVPGGLPSRTFSSADFSGLRRQVEELVKVAREVGAVPVLATHALRAPPGASEAEARRRVCDAALMLRLDAASTVAAYDGYNEMIRTMAREEGLPLADVRAAVPPDGENWGDSTHFRRRGSALAGAAVAGAILDHLDSVPMKGHVGSAPPVPGAEPPHNR